MELVNRKLIKWLFIALVTATVILELNNGLKNIHKVADGATSDNSVTLKND